MQIIEAVVSGYGFFIWTRNRNLNLKQTLTSIVYDRYHKLTQNSVINTSIMSWQLHVYSWVSIVIVAIVTYGVLGFVNDISPVVDALSFAMLMVATIQLNYKKIDSWIYYVIADIFSIVLAFMGHDWYNVIALLLFIVLDLVCFKRWLVQLQKQAKSINIKN